MPDAGSTRSIAWRAGLAVALMFVRETLETGGAGAEGLVAFCAAAGLPHVDLGALVRPAGAR
jgi:hypothetical protein